jgi:hypothetical protein
VLLPCFIPPYYYGYILIGGLNFGEYYTLPNERKKILAVSNADRTLAQALSEFKKGVNKPWMQELIT